MKPAFLSVIFVAQLLGAFHPVRPLSFEQRDLATFVASSVVFHPDRVTIGDVTLRFDRASPHARLEGIGASSPATYLRSGFSRTFAQFPKLAMRGLYPGIDAVFYGRGDELEYDLEIAPGASVNRVKLSFEGARGLRIDERGDLLVETSSGILRQILPPDARYILLAGNRVSFRIGKRDSRLRVTIDPVLVYANYFGGSGNDVATAIATDAQGAIYLAGRSNSVDFPSTSGYEPRITPPLVAISNAGQTITPLRVGSATSVTAIGGSPDGKVLYAATSHGIFFSGDGGATWQQTAPLPVPSSSSTLTVNNIAVDAIDPSRAYIATNLGLFQTDSHGQAWGLNVYGMAAGGNGYVSVASVIVSAVNHTILYATTSNPDHLYKTTLGTGPWQLLNPAYPGEPPVGQFAFSPIVAALVPGGSDLYVVDGNGSLDKSSDGGATWQQLAGLLFGARMMIIDSSNHSNIFVLDNFGLQKSIDGGHSFTTINPTGVQGSSMRAFALDPSTETLYLGTGNQMYVSTDLGATWNTAPLVLPNLHVIVSLGGLTYAGLDAPTVPFVTKWDSTGQKLLYSTFFGGSLNDSINAIKVDAQREAILAGITNSPDFPVITTISTPSPPNTFSGFVAKLSADGIRLVYATVLGSSKGSQINGLAIDSSGSAYVTGAAAPDFPTTSGAFQSQVPATPCMRPVESSIMRSPNLGSYAFVSKLNPSGNALIYSTFLTGSCGGYGSGLSLDPMGEAVVVGATTSPDLPVPASAYQPAFPGPMTVTGFPNDFDAGFLAKLSAAGDKILAASYLGGGYQTEANAVALDSFGNAVITGHTFGFTPGATPGAYKTQITSNCAPVLGIGGFPQPPQGGDAFIVKLDPTFSSARYLTYLGGSCTDSGNNIAIDASGNTWVTGTGSSDFPLVAPFEAQGLSAGFISELSGDGSQLLFSSFSDGTALAIDPAGPVYVAGGAPAYFSKIDPSSTPSVIVNGINPVTAFPNVLTPPFSLPGIAPGQLIRITGSNLGPVTEADAKLDSLNRLPDVLGNTTVFFDNIPAPLITVQSSSILCVAPFEIQRVTQVSVLAGGQRSNSVRTAVATSAPQILAIANQDNTLNSAVHAAKPGSVVVLYVSGLGETAPLSVDGSVNVPPLPVPLVPVAANVNGQSVTPQFVGAAPGLVAGITQINVQIPVAAYSVNPVNINVGAVGQLFVSP